MPKKIISKALSLFVTLSFIIFIGCSRNIQLLLEIDKEDKAIKRDISLGEKRFASLLRDIRAGRIKQGHYKKDIIARYGEPVLELPEDSQALKLLYRFPLGYFDSPKVYLYFDSNQRLTKWDVVRLEGQVNLKD